MTTIFISHPPLYIDIHFIRPYQYRGTSKPYALASTIASVCVEHLFWRVMFHTLPFVSLDLTVGAFWVSVFLLVGGRGMNIEWSIVSDVMCGLRNGRM